MRNFWLSALALCMLLASPAGAQSPLAALSADPPADALNPASTAGLLIPSHGVELDGRLYTASGRGPHPTLLMLDGLPGWHNMADIDMALRRAGWNVLTIHYRGMGPRHLQRIAMQKRSSIFHVHVIDRGIL